MTRNSTYKQYWGGSETKIQYEHWMDEWQYHRIGGPARIWYDRWGNVRYEEYYIAGEYPEGYIEWCEENDISMPLSMEDRLALKLRWA